MSTTQFGRLIGGFRGGIAAAGDAQSTATGLTAGVNVVTSVTGTTADGVRLPADRAAGDMLYIVNTSATAVDVFPSTDGKINGGSANAAKALAANMSGQYISLGGGEWGAVLSA